MFFTFFIALIGYFVWRAVSNSGLSGELSGEVHNIFEFYLSANDILRDDDRRWFGFEVFEVIGRGERILERIPDPPPLVYFALGALHHQVGNHERAIEHLAYLNENSESDEKMRLVASSELKEYVKILRKIERDPNEAPQTSAAIRSLERARRSRATFLLENSREQRQALSDAKFIKEIASQENDEKSSRSVVEPSEVFNFVETPLNNFKSPISKLEPPRNSRKKNTDKPKTITEVLHDVYDESNPSIMQVREKQIDQ